MTGIKALLESRILPHRLIATRKKSTFIFHIVLQEFIFYYIKYPLQRNSYRNRHRSSELRLERDMQKLSMAAE